jgi:hypothetical protein
LYTVACKPFPLQFSGKVNAGNRAECERGRKKIARYWPRLGFRAVAGTELMGLICSRTGARNSRPCWHA